MHSGIKTFFAAALTLAVSGAATAADPSPETYNARALALGGAVTSVPGKLMSARANPAGLAPVRGFFGGASYLTRSVNQLDGISVTLIDNISAPIAGAVNYLRVVTEGESEEVALSLATGVSDFYWGLSARFAHTRKTRTDDWENTFVGDAGLLIIRDSGFTFGLAARDLFDASYEGLRRRVAGGISYTFEEGVMLAADYVRYFDFGISDGSTVHVGAEWKPNQTPWSIRAGMLKDNMTDETYFSCGLGWSNKSFEIDYAYRANKEHGEDDTHVVTLSYPF